MSTPFFCMTWAIVVGNFHARQLFAGSRDDTAEISVADGLKTKGDIFGLCLLVYSKKLSRQI